MSRERTVTRPPTARPLWCRWQAIRLCKKVYWRFDACQGHQTRWGGGGDAQGPDGWWLVPYGRSTDARPPACPWVGPPACPWVGPPACPWVGPPACPWVGPPASRWASRPAPSSAARDP